MSELDDINKETGPLNNELKVALSKVYPIRDRLQQQLVKSYSDELLDKIVELNRIIKKSESLADLDISKAKGFYAKHYPEYVDENNNINERGINRISILKKKWKKLGYLKKKS